MALSFSFVTVPRGYDVAVGATADVRLNGRDCSRLSICALCAEGGDAVRLRDGECPRCLYVDAYALEDWSEEDDDVAAAAAPPPPPFTLDTAHGSVEVTPLADGRYHIKGSGTFGCRETIKSASAAAGLSAGWNPTDKSWTVAAGTDLRTALPVPPPPSHPPPAPRRREDWTREEYQNWLIRHIRRKFFGPCCSHAQAYESRPYGPICYRCERHGATINDYCGD
jgi:hypothetical protein